MLYNVYIRGRQAAYMWVEVRVLLPSPLDFTKLHKTGFAVGGFELFWFLQVWSIMRMLAACHSNAFSSIVDASMCDSSNAQLGREMM